MFIRVHALDHHVCTGLDLSSFVRKVEKKSVEPNLLPYGSVFQTFLKWGPLSLVRMFYGPLSLVRMFYGPLSFVRMFYGPPYSWDYQTH